MRLRMLCYITLVWGFFAFAAYPSRAVNAADESFATGQQLYNTIHYQDAIPELQKFIANYPKDTRVSEAMFLLASCYQNLKQWDNAIAEFTRVTVSATSAELTARRAEAFFQLAECRGEQHDYENAAQAYRSCVKYAAPGDELIPQAQYWLADSLAHLGRSKEALVEYRKMAESAPKHELAPWACYAVGMILLDKSQYSEAITALSGVTAQYPEAKVVPEAKAGLGLAYEGRGHDAHDDAAKKADYARALPLLTAAQNNKELSANSRHKAAFALAQLAADQQQYEKAAAAYAGLLNDLDPADETALRIHLQRGDMFYGAARFRDAADDYAAVADSKGATELTTQALYWLGNSQYQLGVTGKDKAAYTQAVSAFRRFLAAAPTHVKAPHAALLLAVCQGALADLGDAAARAQAVQGYTMVLEKWPTASEAEEARAGIAGLTAGMSLSELEQAVKLLPDGAAKSSASLRLAREYFLAKDYAQTITTAQTVLAGKPSADITAGAAYLIAAAEQLQNHAAEAIPYYQQALANSKAADLTLSAQRGLTSAFLDTKQFPEAREAARALLQLPCQAKAGTEHEAELAVRYRLLARAAVGCKQNDEASEAYAHLVKECPSSPLRARGLDGAGVDRGTEKRQ